MPWFDFFDGNGPVLAHRHKNTDGSLGGWVADTAFVEKSVHVGPDVMVSGQAKVLDNAVLSGNAKISGDTRVGDNARVGEGVILTTGVFLTEVLMGDVKITKIDQAVPVRTPTGTRLVGW